MQNKYKMPDDVRETMIRIVKGHDRRKKKLIELEKEICSIGAAKYETKGDERIFQPKGKGGTSSVVETQADKLMKLHNRFDYKCVKAVDEALAELPIDHYNHELAKKVKECIIASCVYGKKFVFRYSGIAGLERSRFYELRSLFLYLVAKKLEFI